jgi:hypothetical protein
MDDEEPIEREMAFAADYIARERPRAGFFAWPDRQMAEREVVKTFVKAATAEPGFPLRDVLSPAQDPPDCIGRDPAGRAVAVEVTELVDGESIAAAKHEPSRLPWPSWTAPRLLDGLRERLVAKDRVVLKGGPYSEYIVLVFTDEPALTPDIVSGTLEGVSFGPFQQVDRAYFLLSYMPATGGYPYYKLYP